MTNLWPRFFWALYERQNFYLCRKKQKTKNKKTKSYVTHEMVNDKFKRPRNFKNLF